MVDHHRISRALQLGAEPRDTSLEAALVRRVDDQQDVRPRPPEFPMLPARTVAAIAQQFGAERRALPELVGKRLQRSRWDAKRLQTRERERDVQVRQVPSVRPGGRLVATEGHTAGPNRKETARVRVAIGLDLKQEIAGPGEAHPVSADHVALDLVLAQRGWDCPGLRWSRGGQIAGEFRLAGRAGPRSPRRSVVGIP